MAEQPLKLSTTIIDGFQKKLPVDEQAAVDAILTIASENKRHIILTSIFNIIAAFLEVNALGFITIGLTVGMGVSFEEQLQSLGEFGNVLIQFLNSYSPQNILIIMLSLGIMSQILRSTIFFGGLYGTILLQTRVESNIQKQLFKKYVLMPYAEFTKYTVGELYATFSFASHVGTVFQSLSYGISIIVSIIFYIGLMFLLSWRLAIGGIVLFLCLGLIIKYINQKIQIRFQEFFAKSIEMSENNAEFLNSIYEVHSMNREEFVIEYANNSIENAQRAQEKGLFWNTVSRPVAEMFSILGLVIFAVVGYLIAQYSPNPNLFLPQIIAFNFILFRLLVYVQSFNSSLTNLYRFWPSLKKVGHMLSLETKVIEAKGKNFIELNSDIEFRNVSFKYSGSEEYALKDLSFVIPQGQKTALVGRSGSGKSTIVHLLLGMYEPTSGQILVDNIDLRDINIKEWRESLTVISQRPYLYNMEVKENIRFAYLDATDDLIIEAGKAANAHDFIMKMPKQYDTRLGYNGGGVSGGERQRLALARTLIRPSSLLILDEATSALDSSTEDFIQKSLNSYMRGKTTVSIAHRLSTIRDADKIIVLKNGKLLEEGSHAKLISLGGEYTEFWRLQSEKRAENKNEEYKAK